MSRCFPFPPPGYERKVRKENVDLLRKEKHKEKKHKKEKRNKEKREATEKKDKDRGDGKYREKKGRKDKHRDRKNDREKEEEKDKYTDKKSVSGEERATQQVEGCKGQNISQIQGSIKLKSITDEKNDEKRVEAMKDSKLAPEAGRKIHDDGRVGNQLVGKRENGRTVRLATNSIGTWGEVMDRTDEKGVGDRQFDRPGLDYEARHIQMNAVVRNVQSAMQSRLEEVPRPMENIENKVDANEKGKEKEVDGQKGDKRKEKDREGKSQGKGKDKDKERSQGSDKSKDKEKTQGRDKNEDKKKGRRRDEHKDRGKSHGRDKDGDKEKKDEKVKQTGENRNIENDKLKSSNKTNLSCAHDIYRLHPPKDSDSGAAEGKSRKLVEVEANGILLGNDVRPSKLPGTASFHPSAENGVKSVHFHTPTPSASNNEGPIQSPKLDNKGKRKNGMIEAQLSSIPLTHPPSAVAQAVQVAPVSAKSPHPDSMYLNELLSVPKMEEWCCINDEEWLFSSNNSSQSKKPRMGCSEADKIKLVWAKALQIDSADVCALPYVIPY